MTEPLRAIPDLPDRLRLPLRFDAELIGGEIAERAEEWIAHFVPEHYDGDWSVIPLRAKAGATHPITMIYSDPMCRDFADTSFLRLFPSCEEALKHFACPLLSVRLMRLGPGSIIKEHRDFDLDFAQGVARLHIPIVTSDEAVFTLNGRPVAMEAGSCWYLRLSDPHCVVNHGQRARIHLVLDVAVNDWLEALFIAAQKGARMQNPQALQEFRLFVGGRADLVARLRPIDDIDAFIRDVVAAGVEQGFIFDAEDVASALRVGQRLWLSPWATVL